MVVPNDARRRVGGGRDHASACDAVIVVGICYDKGRDIEAFMAGAILKGVFRLVKINGDVDRLLPQGGLDAGGAADLVDRNLQPPVFDELPDLEIRAVVVQFGELVIGVLAACHKRVNDHPAASAGFAHKALDGPQELQKIGDVHRADAELILREGGESHPALQDLGKLLDPVAAQVAVGLVFKGW